MPPLSSLAGATLVERVKMDPSTGIHGVEAFTVSFMHPDPMNGDASDCIGSPRNSSRRTPGNVKRMPRVRWSFSMMSCGD